MAIAATAYGGLTKEKHGGKLRSKTRHDEDPYIPKDSAEGGLKQEIEGAGFVTTLAGATRATQAQAGGTAASSSRFPGDIK